MSRKTKLTSGFLIGSLLLGSSIFSSAALADQIDIGIASAVKNDVKMKEADSDNYTSVAVKDAIYLQSEVSSGDDAKMQILLKDETVFTVGSNTDMTIDEFVYDPSTDSGKMTASIKKGAFRFMSGRVARDPNAVKIKTPSASMGVRGTLFEAVVGGDAAAIAKSSGVIPADADIDDGEDATLIVLRGPGRNNQGSDRRGELDVSTDTMTVTLDRSNSAAFVPADGGDIFGPFPLSVEALELFDNVLRTAPPAGAPSKSVVSVEAIAAAVEESGPASKGGPDEIDPSEMGTEGTEERPDTREEGSVIDPGEGDGPNCNPSPDGVCQG